MDVEAAIRAVEGEVLKLALEVGLHLEQLNPQHLGVDHEWTDRPRPTAIASSTRSSAFAA